MKTIQIILNLLFSCMTLLAQTQVQQGCVKTRGRMVNGKHIPGVGLPGAIVSIKDRNDIAARNNGSFSFPTKGAQYVVQSVTKKDYVLVDADAAPKTYQHSSNIQYLVMEVPEQLLQEKLDKERKIRRTLNKQLQKREDEIEALKAENKISQQRYQQLLQELYAAQENNEKLISEMAERYAKLDYDQMDDFYRQVSNYIEEGELLKAESLLKTRGDLNSQIDKHLQQGALIQQKKTELNHAESVHQFDREELARRCYSYFEKIKMQHLNDSAAYYIKLRASLDSTNYEWISEAGSFIADYLADYSVALRYFQKALTLALEIGQDAYYKLGKAYLNIGGVYEARGDYQQAQQYFNKALSIYQTINEYSLDVATCYNCLGSSLSHVGNYDEALKYLKKALELRVSIEGDQSLNSALSYNNIGSIYSSLGNYQDALSYFQKALNIRLKFGVDTENIASSYHNLGSLMSKLGEYSKAIEYFEKAISINTLFLGENHPHLAYLYNNLGYTYSNMRVNDKALEYYQKTLDIRIRLFGELYPQLSTTYNNIALIHKRDKHYDKAIEYYQKSLSVVRSISGDKSEKIGIGYNNIGSLYIEQKDYIKALEFFNMAKDIYIDCFGEEHPDLGVIYGNIARGYQQVKDYPQATLYCQKAILIMSKANLATPSLGICYGNLGNILFAMGEYSQSLDSFNKAIQILESKLGKGHSITQSITQDMLLVKEVLTKMKKE